MNTLKNIIQSLSESIHDSQIMTAVIFGMCIQFFYGSSKSLKVAVTIIISSIFVALYIVSPVIEIAGIGEGTRLAIGLYALSSLISMEMLAIMLTVMPEVFKSRLKKFLEVGK